MKYKQVIEITTESYTAEQFMLRKFPDAWWYSRGSNIVFVLPMSEQNRAGEAVEEYEQLKREAGVK